MSASVIREKKYTMKMEITLHFEEAFNLICFINILSYKFSL